MRVEETLWEGAWERKDFQDKQLPHSSYNEVTEFAESEDDCWRVKNLREVENWTTTQLQVQKGAIKLKPIWMKIQIIQLYK